jgi:hypothetical protein
METWGLKNGNKELARWNLGCEAEGRALGQEAKMRSCGMDIGSGERRIST